MMVDISNKKLNKKKSFFSKNKRVICDTHFLTLSKAGTFTSFSSQNKYAEISLFYKNNKRLKNTIFSAKKGLELFTFLPFETPSLLFLPKMGTVLFYSSSFSMINYF